MSHLQQSYDGIGDATKAQLAAEVQSLKRRVAVLE